ncbi:MAG TPA: hypothetical protein VLE99_00315 [Candidatus Saccharimonadales bacterium]|nr:hypothetical protein [Candidatus Saccharimonadales bacterium]
MADKDDSKPRRTIAVHDGSETQQNKPNADGSAEQDDPKTAAAVDDIVKQEGDDGLAAQDEAAEKAIVMQQGFWERFKNKLSFWWASPRARYSLLGGILLVLAALGAVPFTRYNVAGLVLKTNATVTVVDSKSGAPVSGATVVLGGMKGETDAAGKVTLHVRAGSKHLTVSKQYYTGFSRGELVALSGNSFKATLVALGHQVQVKVVNKLTGKPLASAAITVQNTNTKTDTNGLATVVIPSGASLQEANVSLAGYNTSKVNVYATGDLAKNTFSIAPAGKLYFLSNLSGNIDVVKTNLDGSDRQTVLAGTGHEDPATTSLLASRDWKYLVLLSKRSSDNTASVYLIDTTNNDALTTVDKGSANFILVGWSGDRFVYEADRTNVAAWQSGGEALKSFDPTTGHTLLLDQTQGSGSSNIDYANQTFSVSYLVGDQVVYAKNWQGMGANVLDSKQAEFDSIGSDGSGHKVVKSFAPTVYPSDDSYHSIGLDARLYEPGEIYIDFFHDGQDDFFDYAAGKISSDTSLTPDKFYQTVYGSYLLSPSGNSTFWTEERDGKNTLFTGDSNGQHQKQVASLSDYRPYGWFTDDYLLVSKNSSELYVMPTQGGTPFKITDYYKPAINYNGYGGGYGGL